MKALLRTGIFLLTLFLCLEGISWSLLFYLARFQGLTYQPIFKNSLSENSAAGIRRFWSPESPYFVPSPSLGWTVKPGGVFGKYRANSQGLRAEQEYDQTPPAGAVRIASFGDSFTHGDEVEFAETWEQKLAEKDTRFEVLNFGVSAYGVDQAFLRYQEEGAAFKPQIVLIGFLSENIERTVNVFRVFYGNGTHFPLAKPRFVLENGQLTLMKNPLPAVEDYQRLLQNPRPVLARLGQEDYQYQIHYGEGHYDFLASVRLAKIITFIFYSRFSKNHIINWSRIYNPDSEAFRISAGILKAFYETAKKNGSQPVILLFPDRYDLERYRRKGIKRYAPLKTFIEEEGILYLDLMNAFEEQAKQEPVPELCQAHYTPRGNEIVANAVFEFLKENHLI